MAYARTERLAEFFSRLAAAPAASTAADALALVNETLEAVEDEMSGMPNEPTLWASDQRLYPPEIDRSSPMPGVPEVTRYRTRAHNVFVANNGAIEIRREAKPALHGELVLRKAGQDGRELDTFYR